MPKWSSLRRLWRSERAPIPHSVPFHPLRGGIELVTPSMVAGWAFHPDVTLTEVKLLVGPLLISKAPLNGHRSDVAETIGFDGSFGFQLNIPADFPLLFLDSPPQVIVVSEDGQERFPLHFLADPKATASLLSQALQPDLRGLQGHFDGFSDDGSGSGSGSGVSGWAWRPGSENTTVWLQADNLPPRAVACNLARPDLEMIGHPLHCGFALSLTEWPEALGRRVKASFDQEGRLFLPQTQTTEMGSSESSGIIPTTRLPIDVELSSLRAVEAGLTPAAPLDTYLQSTPVGPMLDTPISLDAHWQALEDFKLLMDHIEAKVDDLERIQPPLRRRSARFRLWR